MCAYLQPFRAPVCKATQVCNQHDLLDIKMPSVSPEDGSQRGCAGRDFHLRMEVETHDASLGSERVLWVRGILERKAADDSRSLLHEIVATIPHSKQVVILRVPAQCCHVLSPNLSKGVAGQGRGSNHHDAPQKGRSSIFHLCPNRARHAHILPGTLPEYDTPTFLSRI